MLVQLFPSCEEKEDEKNCSINVRGFKSNSLIHLVALNHDSARTT
jgi:hypothetical protein